MALKDTPCTQAIEVRDTLAGRHNGITLGDPAPEQYLETINRPFWLGTKRNELSEVCFVLADQFLESQMHSPERLVVRWEDKHIRRQDSL